MIIVTTTSDNRQELETIARVLVEKQLAACCQIGGPITSVYTWNGKTESTDEWTCSIKTIESLFDQVAAEIKSNHQYDVPQIVAVKSTLVDKAYDQWVKDNVI
jgi:periplasmic divalent cation tolerance protein